jgi:hypothetical protein
VVSHADTGPGSARGAPTLPTPEVADLVHEVVQPDLVGGQPGKVELHLLAALARAGTGTKYELGLRPANATTSFVIPFRSKAKCRSGAVGS